MDADNKKSFSGTYILDGEYITLSVRDTLAIRGTIAMSGSLIGDDLKIHGMSYFSGQYKQNQPFCLMCCF